MITDRRIQACAAGGVIYYKAQTVSVSDYYPFGMQIKERTWSAPELSYRFGFQGQEGDDEIKGSGNSIEYKYRIHDSRLGRFLSVDPLSHQFSWNSPFAFSENRVTDGVELEGKEVMTIHVNGTASALISVSIDAGILIEVQTGAVYINGGGGLGIETNASVAGQFSVTIFPSANSYKDIEGWGYITGVAGGEGVVGSMNYVSTWDNKHKGINYTMGAGVGISPVAPSGYITYNGVSPLSKDQRTFALDKLGSASLEISFKLIELNNQKEGIEFNNLMLQDEISDLENQLFDGFLSQADRDNINMQISENKSQISSNNSDITSVEKSIDQLETMQQGIGKAINNLQQQIMQENNEDEGH